MTDTAGMNEMDIARAIVAETQPSPTTFFGSTYMAMRFTGTGVAHRPSIDEFVYRDPAIWLSDSMARRIVGVPVIAEHAAGKVLDGEELSRRVIGTVALGFIKAAELWAVTRVIDALAAAALKSGEFDTSPAVLFAQPSGNYIVTIADDERLLVEGEPSFIDHLAIVWTGAGNAGVWSKGGSAEPAVEVETYRIGE